MGCFSISLSGPLIVCSVNMDLNRHMLQLFLYIKQRTSYCSINTVSVHVFGVTATAHRTNTHKKPNCGPFMSKEN